MASIMQVSSMVLGSGSCLSGVAAFPHQQQQQCVAARSNRQLRVRAESSAAAVTGSPAINQSIKKDVDTVAVGELQKPLSGTTVAVEGEAEVLKRQQLFNKIAPMYDNLNDWLSLGQHRVWKRMAVSWSGVKAGDTVLDICCGSGDLSFLLAEKIGRRGKVIGLDFAKEQLIVAAERQENLLQTSSADIEWIHGDALSLPFDDSTFDAITMGYGLRNVANISQALAEIHRVLKPGRAASILDFNRSPNPLTSQVQDFMLDNVVVPVATYLGVQEEYAYLKTSISRFPLGAEQEQLAANEGFSKAVHYELAGGLMGVLVANK